MTTKSGNDCIYSLSDIQGEILRNELTKNSIDQLPSQNELRTLISKNETVFIKMTIINNSYFPIQLSYGTGISFMNGETGLISPWRIYHFNFIVTKSSTKILTNSDINYDISGLKVKTSTIEPLNDSDENIILGTSSTKIISSGPLTVYGNVYTFQSVSSLSSSANLTYSVGQVIGGFIKRECISASRTDTFPSASQIIAAIPNADIGISFNCMIQNTSTGSFNINLSPGEGMTLSTSDSSIERYKTQSILFVIDNIDPGTEAITAYFLGTLASSGGTVSNLKTVTTTTYTILSTDNTINVDTNTIKDTCTLTLPKIIGKNKYYFITDSTGKASIYNIRVIPSLGDTIVGTSSVTINSNYSSISLYNDENSNWILY